MVKIQTLVTAIMGVTTTTASAANVTFARNFATEKLNSDSPFYDLSEFGYIGGQLPKVYGLNQTTSGAVYLPEESFKEFQNIVAGKNNATAEFSSKQKALFSVGKRSSTNHISMLLRNAAGASDSFTVAADHEICHTGSYSPWHYVVVYYILEAYITFWKSDACNGHHGSFNPVYDYYDDPSEVCIFNFKPQSFRVYSGCHNSYGSGDGCSSHTL
ncbi:hypothetical protein N7476_004884 [Penicillium atrosanguineum]|uniref:Uncharacterized protein n=1 Tax=Penicillium atrosanguineum TaxID=1132637 RepID=A0A9W9Q1S5_9EURO|nr:hypothetical protein N7526_001815 [Penicillium atrosanguineum]KAJ5318464.1 hypothetical protein N7476_004884 [Penicillium atrosanguineum]